MKVEQLEHANQFLITEGNKRVFQSYNSLIATFENGILTLNGSMWDYSATTRRHFKIFINDHTFFKYENKAQWLKLIQNNPDIKVTQ